LPYGSAEDINQWAAWFSTLDFLNHHGDIDTQQKMDRIKEVAAKSRPKELATKFGLDRINSKLDFDQLLSFELFDFNKHASDSADLFRLFSF
jgi:hypothetical protein